MEEKQEVEPVTGQGADTPARLLVVEDDLDIQGLMMTILEDAGYGVSAVTTAAGALATMETSLPRVVLVDNHLPDMTGAELIQQIRARWGGSVKLMSVSAASKVDMEKQRMDVDSILEKPFDLADLISSVGSLLNCP